MPAKNKTPVPVADGLVNVVSGLGTAADKSAASRYAMGYVSQDQSESAYRTSVFRKIVDIPADEKTAGGRQWQADDTDIEELESYERRLRLWPAINAVEKAATLHGGAVLIMGLPGDPESPPPKPGNGALSYVFPASRYQVQVGPIDRDVRSEFFGQPTYYELNNGGKYVRIHPGRVIPVVRQPLPLGALQVMNNNEGFWGDPLLLYLNSALRNVDTAQGGVASLIHEMKVDTIGIVGLTSMVSTTEGENALRKRLQVAQTLQSLLNTRVIDAGGDSKDSKGESWDTRQLSFAGLPEVMREFKSFIAGLADVPYTRLWGESPGGLNSTGKGEQIDFNRSIRSKQNTDIRPILERLDEYLIPSALGSRPSDVYWTFAPLTTPEPAESAAIEKTMAETVKVYAESGVVPESVIDAMARNRLIESGQWPGVESAYEESDAEPDFNDVPDPDPVRQTPPSEIETDEPRQMTDAVSDEQATAVLRRLWDYLSGKPATDR